MLIAVAVALMQDNPRKRISLVDATSFAESQVPNGRLASETSPQTLYIPYKIRLVIQCSLSVCTHPVPRTAPLIKGTCEASGVGGMFSVIDNAHRISRPPLRTSSVPAYITTGAVATWHAQAV
jgi:hypothetical protein